MRTIFIALAVAAAGFSASAQDPIDYIEARQGIMKFIGQQMRTLGGMQQGRIEFDEQYVQTAGKAIETMAKTLPLLFPEGTETGGNTEALPAIFEDPGNFWEATVGLQNAARQLQQSVSQEHLQQSFRYLNDSCRSCHSRFRR